MKDTEVLDLAIKKAQRNGWDELHSQYIRVFNDRGLLYVECLLGIDEPTIVMSYERIIFSLSFAEHFWGMDTWYFVVHIDQAPGMDDSIIGWKSEKELQSAPINLEYYDNIPAYEYHRQQLLTEETQDARIAYIEQFL